MDAAEREALLDRIELAPLGPNTLTDRTALTAELERVREEGIAVNNEELAFGLRSIAAPVRGQSGNVVAAINLAVHRSWVSIEDLVTRLSPPLRHTAEAISHRIGYR
jgi:IclR family pca regulon transcriptional regulator